VSDHVTAAYNYCESPFTAGYPRRLKRDISVSDYYALRIF